MNNIDFHIENVDIPDLDPEFLRLWIKAVVESQQKQIGEITYIFCSDDFLLDINMKYLNHNYYTDIITFNYNIDKVLNGDVYISYDTVISNAEEFSQGNVKDELERVIIHGVLHLAGFNDKTEDEQVKMTKMEDWALAMRKRFT